MLLCELRNHRDTSKLMISSALLNPKFAIGLAANLCELRVRGTGTFAGPPEAAHDRQPPFRPDPPAAYVRGAAARSARLPGGGGGGRDLRPEPAQIRRLAR